MLDGMNSTADVIEKILDLLYALGQRVRLLEAIQVEKPTKPRVGFGLNCANNSCTL
jgi:hypothetical protein